MMQVNMHEAKTNLSSLVAKGESFIIAKAGKPITTQHTLLTGTLPMIHKDPFDRILVAQSIAEGISLITSDEIITKYPAPVILIRK